jgi:3-isopropylmalate/(R)-2-methylmalate dehydratase small subunit
MEPFRTLSAPAAPLDVANVDTDQIIPARFLRKPRSAGYDNFLFHDVRREAEGFPLDRPDYAGARVLVADANFGCGSSREGAVYALVDAGIRCVVAPSFGDIFAGNAAKNGLLTVVLDPAATAELRRQLRERPGASVAVDLAAQTVTFPDGSGHGFEIDAFRKETLLEGLDDVELTLREGDAIAAFEAADAEARPWARPSVPPEGGEA